MKIAGQGMTPAGAEFVRATVMVTNFYTGMPFDLKNSSDPNRRSGQAFGNWFYGAVAAEMGYSMQQAVTAGAVVQQLQNYTYPDNAAYHDISATVKALVNAALTGQGDNPGDADLIKGGFEYASKVFDVDPNRKGVSNSCDKSSPRPSAPGDVGGATSIGIGSSWLGGSISPTPGCYGNCGGPTGGNVSVGPIKELMNSE